ncbi:glyoxylate reductase/hydroxypyruvate reductase [Teleopsis dalmanni]|uniref:glyoxylate reductase/hydroxypyruvate reductase n=1 Tax=Teleopsis dalmanni TaxID=139649 RepID=UPI0018CE611E|nr:glyoxylate reductase/hydroxypyruvate reductase [Teleopsis dalmanni]
MFSKTFLNSKQNQLFCIGMHQLLPKWNTFHTSAIFYGSKHNRNLSRKMNNQPKNVFITRADVPDIGLKLLKESCNVETWSGSYPIARKDLLDHVVGKDALFCTLSDKIDNEVIEKAGPQLKCISTMSVGYEHIDLAACNKRGIRVGYTPDVLTDATAELTLALLLATSRRLFEANKEVYNGGWKSWAPFWMCGNGLKGSRVGLFGFGRIGQEIAARIVPFKPAKITYTSRTEKPEAASAISAAFVSFDEMLRESDFIIACCALTPETKEIFNREAFAKMKKNAIFINTARGGVVEQSALREALQEQRILGAGLDVTTPEPLPLDDPLLTLNNAVILPHIGSADVNTRIEMSRITACNILAAFSGDKMIAEVQI